MSLFLEPQQGGQEIVKCVTSCIAMRKQIITM